MFSLNFLLNFDYFNISVARKRLSFFISSRCRQIKTEKKCKSPLPPFSIQLRINYHTVSTLPVISLTLNKILPNTRIIHNLLKCSIIINVNDEINSMEEDFTDFTYLQSSKNATDSILKRFILLLEDLIYFIFV